MINFKFCKNCLGVKLRLKSKKIFIFISEKFAFFFSRRNNFTCAASVGHRLSWISKIVINSCAPSLDVIWAVSVGYGNFTVEFFGPIFELTHADTKKSTVFISCCAQRITKVGGRIFEIGYLKFCNFINVKKLVQKFRQK